MNQKIEELSRIHIEPTIMLMTNIQSGGMDVNVYLICSTAIPKRLNFRVLHETKRVF